MVAASPERRRELARAAVNARWARTANRTDATKAGREGLLRRYLPEGFDDLDPALQEKLVDSARKAHAAKMRAAKLARREAGGEAGSS